MTGDIVGKSPMTPVSLTLLAKKKQILEGFLYKTE